MQFDARPSVGSLVLAALAASPLAAQDRFATEIVDYSPGVGGGIFDPLNLLGGPQGAGFSTGSLHVTSLGDSGSVTLGFDVTIVDGPGADFSVFENGFLVSGSLSSYAEVGYVAVSSNGTDFAEFIPRVVPDTTQLGAFAGLSGGLPVLTNVETNSIDPFDPVVSGGEAFDLADLVDDPLVVGGSVDLDSIAFVRLRDVPLGAVDGSGVPIVDSAPGNPDFDAVAVIQHAGLASSSQPVCDLSFDALDRLVVTIGDPDGLGDLDLATVRASFSLAPLPVTVLLSALDVVAADATTLVLRSPVPIPGTGIFGALAVSARDEAGAFAGDQLMLHP